MYLQTQSTIAFFFLTPSWITAIICIAGDLQCDRNCTNIMVFIMHGYLHKTFRAKNPGERKVHGYKHLLFHVMAFACVHVEGN